MYKLPRSVVLLDTNVYRDLGADPDRAATLAQLRKWEFANGVQAFAHPYVMWEILSRAADPSLSDDNPWVNAVTLVATHARGQFQRDEPFCTLADPETEFCRVLYESHLPRHERFAEVVLGLVDNIGRAPSIRHEALAQEQLGVLQRANETIEQQWVDDLWNFVVAAQIPTATPGDWHAFTRNPVLSTQALAWLRSPLANPVFAMGLVLRAQGMLDIQEDASATEAKSKWLAGKYGVGFSLYNNIVQRIVTTGCDLSKPRRRNWVWDMHIAFSVGPGHTYAGRTARLVTNDGDILKAAEASDAREHVLSMSAYLELLEQGRAGAVS